MSRGVTHSAFIARRQDCLGIDPGSAPPPQHRLSIGNRFAPLDLLRTYNMRIFLGGELPTQLLNQVPPAPIVIYRVSVRARAPSCHIWSDIQQLTRSQHNLILQIRALQILNVNNWCQIQQMWAIWVRVWHKKYLCHKNIYRWQTKISNLLWDICKW